MSTLGTDRSVDQASTAARLVSVGRRRHKLSQRALAKRAGVPQPTVATIESGQRDPSVAMLQRLIHAAGFALEYQLTNTVPPSRLLEQYATDVSRLLATYPIARSWVFGSVATGEDSAASDLDILVELSEGFSAASILGFDDEISALLSCPVDVVTTKELEPNGLLARKVRRRLRELPIGG